MRPRRLVPVLVALSCAVVARADGPILHEYVPDVGEDEGAVLVTSGGAEPEAIVYRGEVLPAPAEEELGDEERPMVATPGDGSREELPGQRSPTFTPDRLTHLEGTLGYYEVFTPATAPFKRVTALDTVALASDGVTPVLGVGTVTRRRLRVEGATAAAPDGRARDQFWGSVVLDFSGGRAVPLPSVSPESRILTARTDPQTIVSFEKDGADNFYAVAIGPASSHVRLTFLTDAPRTYFGTAIPSAPSDALAEEVAPLPASVQRRAEVFAQELGLHRGMPLRTVLEALTRHFRSFESSEEPPRDTGDVYLDLARGKKGVCRHRAYAFVITAQALGVPSRFVQNEAHAWVEVKMPTIGFMRIDLGGAAQGLEAHGADDRPLYRPESPDPLPRPEAYERSYSQLRGDVQGLRQEDAPPGAAAQGSAPGAGGDGAPPSRADGTEPSVAPPPGGAGSGASATSANGRPLRPRRGAATPVSIAVHTFYDEVFRGREIQVTGRVAEASGRGVSGMRIEVALAAPRGDRALLLGVTVSREDGYFRASFGVPPDMPVGTYRLHVVTPGDGSHLPAIAR